LFGKTEKTLISTTSNYKLDFEFINSKIGKSERGGGDKKI